jgi:CRP-like cAMP-binding protein
MANSNHSKTGNRVLDALTPEALALLRPHFETVPLALNQAIQEPGEKTEFVYFPTCGMISIVAAMADGAAVEIGMAGKEGMFGISIILGDDTPPQKAMVQLPGSALRVRSAQLRRAVEASAEFHGLLLRYAQAVLTTATQSAACNRLHSLEQRCARWLLSARDRAEGDTFPMTHEFLAMMLGVRRPGVTLAVQNFRDGGMITYNHGTMTVLDRVGLETGSCECYRFIQDESNRLLGGKWDRAPRQTIVST